MKTSNPQFDVIIVGAGLSGLMAAYTLTELRPGAKITVLEARGRIGGRIHTVGGFDLGPTWFWGHQQNVIQFIRQHGLAHFPQFEEGHSVFEQIGREPERFRPNWQQPVSHRIVGGMMSLIDALAGKLAAGSIRLNHVVQSIKQTAASGLEVSILANGEPKTLYATDVVVTLPPHLAATTITYDPILPADLKRVMQATPTWMGEAMKVSLVYEKPFWREQNLSGMAISYAGPVQQFHDASPADGGAGALFGWVGNGGPGRLFSPEDRQKAVVEQAIRLFGPRAAGPLSYAETNWEQEPFTTNLADPDRAVAQQHPQYGHPLFHRPLMGRRLWWATTEASPVEGGYLDGALYIGRSVAVQIAEVRANKN